MGFNDYNTVEMQESNKKLLENRKDVKKPEVFGVNE